MGVMEKFNKGETVESAKADGNGFAPTVWKITDISIQKAGKVDHPLAKAVDEDTELIVVNMETEKGEENMEVQFYNEKDGVVYYAFPRSEYNGKAKPATFLYDVIHNAKIYDADQKQLAVEGFNKEKFIGLKFEIGTKFGSNDSGDYTILETDYQKLKNEQYAAEQKATEEVMDTGEEVTESDLPF